MANSSKLGKGILVLVVLAMVCQIAAATACTQDDECGLFKCVSKICKFKCVNDGECATGNICKINPKQASGVCAKPAQQASTDTAPESKPVTLISDKVFLEAYDKKSKIIDASKITYKNSDGQYTPIFDNPACILNNDDPNLGGRVEVTVKVFNNIDEQIDTMTFVMKAGGDLWEYATCGDGEKGICATGDDSYVKGWEATKNSEYRNTCNITYKGFEGLFAQKQITCYTAKAAAGIKNEAKTDEKNNNCVKFEGYECIELKNIKGLILSYQQSNKCKTKSDCQGNNCCGSTDDSLCCKKNS